MYPILIAGGGKIGASLAYLLAISNRYQVTIIDKSLDAMQTYFDNQPPASLHLVALDTEDQTAFKNLISKHHIQAVVSCLPYFCNKTLVELAQQCKIHYFDLTEDVKTAEFITALAKKSSSAFVPQCGVAPGLVNILTHDLAQSFETLDSIQIRCGALPENTNNPLHYAVTWSIDGLINEYANPCEAIENGLAVKLLPLENLETIQLDGLQYEAFNTSGGLGSLTKYYAGKVNTLNYKTIRYPGHCEKIKFLMKKLDLQHDRETLKNILAHIAPYTDRDVVIIYVSIIGRQQKIKEQNFIYKYYPKIISNKFYSAIQLTTAATACAVIDIVTQQPQLYQGRIYQEQFNLSQILRNPFGQYLDGKFHEESIERITP